MDNSVLQGILKQCREAMFASIPIVYIKTDSDIVIEELVKTKHNPLVTLVYNGVLESDEQKRELVQYRPIYSLGEEYAQNEYIKNYKPNAIDNGKSCFWSDFKAFPHIVTQKMPLPSKYDAEIIKKRRSILEQLKAYVNAYHNPGEENYEILQNSIIILYSSQVDLTPYLLTYTEVIEMDYPDEEEIRSIIKTQMGTELRNCVGDSGQLSRLCTDMFGFTGEEVSVLSRRILAACSLKDTQTNNKNDTSKYINKLIQKYKQQKLEGSVLEQVSFNQNTDIAGMVNFRTWLTQQSEPLNRSNEYKTKLGIDPPNGVLLCGIPGCGKTEAAKFAAKTLNLPLLRMDVGSMMDKYVGESEKNMREALKMAEAMSPCVLMIDEIEKGFSDAGAQGENGTFKRMFATLLGWMQDNTYPCFIFATANNISVLPKEFFRSGRFDQKFSVFLPDTEQCVAIFINSMRKAQNNVLETTNRELFTQECLPTCENEKQNKDKKLKKLEEVIEAVIDNCLVDDNNKPRIIVGSDIQLAVENALRICAKDVLGGYTITREQWKAALEKAMSSETFTTYGEGDENVDAIVASYCQMLRKGFLNTSKQQLFRYEDYQASAFYDKEKWQKELDLCEDEKEAKALKKKISECKILKHSDIEKRGFHSKYDKAVYEFLYERINYMAFQIEAYERDKSIGLRR